MRQLNMNGTAFLGVAVIVMAFVVGLVGFTKAAELFTGSTTTSTSSSDSGMEFITANGKQELTLIRGCDDGEVLKWDATDAEYDCSEDATASVTGAGADVLDLDDDDSNESSDFNELATTSGCSSVNGQFVETITEPSADKVLFTCNAPDFSDLSGTATDAQIPDSITITNATNAVTSSTSAAADELANDPANCAAQQFPKGISQTGQAQGCATLTDADIPDDITIDLATAATTSSTSATADAFAADPPGCAAGEAINDIDQTGAAHGCITVGGAQNVFSTFDAELGSDPVADSTTDTIIWDSPNASVAVTGNSSTDTMSLDVLYSPRLASNPANCTGIQLPKGIDQFGAAENCAALVDADIPDDITIDNATAAVTASTAATADAFAADPTGCAVGEGIRDIDQNGTAHGCTDFEEDLVDSDGLAAALNDENGTGDVLFDTDPIIGGTAQVTGSGSSLRINLFCGSGAFGNGGALTTDGNGEVICSDDDGGAGGTDTNANTECSGTTTFLDGEGNCDELTSPNGTVAVTGAASAVQFDVLDSPSLAGTTVTNAAQDDTVLIGNGVAFGVWVGLPDCDDSGGNHLNYDTTAGQFSCGTTASGNFDGSSTQPSGCAVVAANDAPQALKDGAYATTNNNADEVEIQDAMNNFDCVLLAGRQFTISDPLKLNDGQHLRGLGRNPFNSVVAAVGTEIKLAASQTDEAVITLTGTEVRHFTLSDFWVNGNGDSQSGTNGDGIYIDWTGSSVVNARRVVIRNVGVWNTQRDGIFLDLPAGLGGGVADVDDILVLNSGRYGLHLHAPDGVYVNAKVFGSDDDGIVLGDNSGNSEFIGGFSKNNTGDGVYISGGGNRSAFVGFQVQDNEQHGVNIDRSDTIWSGVVFDSNGRAQGNTYDNMFISGNADNTQVTGSLFVDRQGTPEIRYHINIPDSGSDETRITASRFDDNAVTAAVQDNGTGTIIAHTTGHDVITNNRHNEHPVMPASDCNAANEATAYVTSTNTFSCQTFNAFSNVDAPTGTDPSASGFDTLTLTSPNSTVSITGAASNTVQFDIPAGAIDIDQHTNLACGRSLTCSGDSVEADAELYTIKKSVNVVNPLTGSMSNLVQFEYATAVTVTEVSCSTDQGTVVVQLDYRSRSTPNTAGTNVLSSSLTCDNDSQTTTSFSNAGIAADVPVNVQLSSGGGSPTIVRIHIKATRDD